MAAHKIGELLAKSGELKTLSREARRLAEIEQLLFEAVPRALAEATRIKNVRAGTLFLLADNAAVAAKLRQLAPRLLIHVRKRELEVNGIRVEVQPASAGGRIAAGSSKRPLAADAIRNFQSLADGLRESALKNALTRLLQHHKKRSEQ